MYADQDWDALHVRAADEAYALPGTAASRTYHDGGAVRAAALRAGADAVHPGCGSLAEDAAFADAVRVAGLTWIGPHPDVVRRAVDNVAARDLAVDADVAVLPGRPVAHADDALAFAEEHGLPIVLKPVHGGRLRVVGKGESVRQAYQAATRRATPTAADGEWFAERWAENARHVEVQVVADAYDTVVAVGTRDCSVQRRRSPLVAEAPAPFLSPDQEALLERSALAIARAVHCVGVLTVAFLLTPSAEVFFLGMTPRLTVDHPTTEATSGIDLVREQFRVASGLPLSVDRRPQVRGHALGFRVTAEDPGRGFLLSPGAVATVTFPSGPGVRVDSGTDAGSVIPEAFDPLLATVTVSGRDRAEAVSRARRALGELSVSGIATTLPFHRSLLRDPDFVSRRRVHTGWVDTDRTAADEPQDEYSDLEPDLALVPVSVEVDGERTLLRVPAELLSRLTGEAWSGLTEAVRHSP